MTVPPRRFALHTMVALCTGLAWSSSPGAAGGRESPPRPPGVEAQRLVHPDVRSSPTVTGSAASFAPVTQLRELGARATREMRGRAPWTAPARAALDAVAKLTAEMLEQQCNPLLVNEAGTRAVLGLGAALDRIPDTAARGRRARLRRTLAELQRLVTNLSRESVLSSIAWLTQEGVGRENIVLARGELARADARHEAGDLIGAASGYADAQRHITFECVLDEEAFTEALAQEGSRVSVGWAYAIGRFGGLVASEAGGHARLAQNAPTKNMTPQTKINTASTAKILTTVTALRLLTSQGIGLDSAIGPWLPQPWPTNPYFDQITFRELLTHTSGIGGANQKMADGWEQLKEIAVGFVSPLKQQQYENVNMGLFRALIPEILGFATEAPQIVNPGVNAGVLYASHVNDVLLSPSGVSTALCDDPESPPTLYYPNFISPDSGWLPGNLLFYCGGGGWYLSAEDWIKVLGAVRYGGILSGAEKAELYGTPLGWWPRLRTYGVVYMHNGALGHPQGGVRNCIGDFPGGWQVAFHVNSNVTEFPNDGWGNYDACTAVIQAFDDAWTPVMKATQ